MKNLRKVITSLVLIAISFVSYTQDILKVNISNGDSTTTLIAIDSVNMKDNAHDITPYKVDRITIDNFTEFENMSFSILDTNYSINTYSILKYDTVYIDTIIHELGSFKVENISDLLTNKLLETGYNITRTDTMTGATFDYNNTHFDYNNTYYVYIRVLHDLHYKYLVFNIKFTVPPSLVSVNEETIEEVTNTIVYPNPVVNNMTVKFETSNSDMPVEVYNLNGEMIYKNNDYRAIGSNEITINMNDFRKGLYLVKVGNEVKKVIKK